MRRLRVLNGSWRSWPVMVLGVLVMNGCGAGDSTGSEDVGAALVALSVAPTDVSCLEVTATGTRQVIKDWDVVAGANQTFEIAGLPLGDVQFSALAFAEKCSQHQGATPTWTSDPVVERIAKNVVAQVMLVMRRNGRASIAVDFADCVAGFVDLGTLDGTATINPVDMNSQGWIVGTTATEPFLWSGGIMHPLGTGVGSNVVAINDKAQVAGNSANGAFLWQDGVTDTIGTLGGGGASATAMNEVGQVTGASVTSGGDQHAFIWQPGGDVVDLGTLGGGIEFPDGAQRQWPGRR